MEHRRPASLLETFRPLHLVTAVLIYGLGAGIARHLGESLNSGALVLGLLWLISLLAGYYSLGDALELPMLSGLSGHIRLIRQGKADPDQAERSRMDRNEVRSGLGLACLLMAAALTTWLGWLGWLNPISVVILILIAAGILALLLPGLQPGIWSTREVIFSLVHAVLPAGWAFSLQTGEYHRLLALSTFPLFGLHLASLLIFQLTSFQEDLQAGYPTLLTGIGWVRSITLHNLLVVASFLLLALAMFFGFPASVILPATAAVLPAAYLVWYLTDLKRGAPVRWLLLTALSLVTLYLPIYFFLFSFWFD